MTNRVYKTPAAFKQSLEQRLRTRAAEAGLELNGLRQLVVFDRFLARLQREFGDDFIVKGGLCLEYRIQRARTTKDIDLRFEGDPDHTTNRMLAAAGSDFGDHLRFQVGASGVLQSPGMRIEGRRLRVHAQLGGRPYAARFGVDVAFGDPMRGTPEHADGADYLAFAGIEPTRVLVYPVETHVAEKLHAYTRPRDRPNTRLKDLPDIALLARVKDLSGVVLRSALEQTWAYRDTHPIPAALPDPPAEWNVRYAQLVARNRLEWPTLDEVTQAAKRFLNPVLAGPMRLRWHRASGRWA